ncbi:MAG: LysE family translocator, partial [Cyanobacteria bacterium P01_D01_bin.71]
MKFIKRRASLPIPNSILDKLLTEGGINMPELTQWGIFLTAAMLLAITPGPGIFYVLTRSIRGGRREGIYSSLGTTVGGLAHVVAAALGISAILANSAIAFLIVKYAGAAYLIYLGLSTLTKKVPEPTPEQAIATSGQNAFSQGITTEILNPKTALFFLAFIPQFVNPAGNVALQFILLGTISVSFNT